ncbi:hypothetical protein [Alkaliphilus hydrothermalis]|uniref:Tetratricopeptide repeat-containing protein n=1 Tax=Alkaliphilus hydrothermalis TaxID=1482730 RepID=A0ABS2NLQ4_9FIRM|nr:hypothetical protein [Alkaliphilus hydrothermalis]MBM7613821.1 hypothetical protein [Alkaliphilus hydrothermalis]
MEILIGFGVVIILYLVIYFIPLLKRTKNLESKLAEGKDIKGYIAELDKMINKTKNKKYENFLMISKSSGLLALGKYREAANLLKLVDLGSLPNIYIVQYYNNLLYSQLMQENLNDAEALREASRKLLGKYEKQKSLKNSIKNTFATYEYYLGDLEKSQSMFEELLKDQNSILLYKIASHYFLGLIDLKKENKEQAKEKFEKVLNTGHNNIFFEKKAASLLKEL